MPSGQRYVTKFTVFLRVPSLFRWNVQISSLYETWLIRNIPLLVSLHGRVRGYFPLSQLISSATRWFKRHPIRVGFSDAPFDGYFGIALLGSMGG